MPQEPVTVRRLLLKLTLYFMLLFGITVVVALIKPDLLSLMPLGGNDAIEVAGINVGASADFESQLNPSSQRPERQTPMPHQIGLIAAFLAVSLGATILVMLPVTWTYIATKSEVGFHRNFARTLLVLPICAATIVLLIQNNLALAFGLAALVAAVRFRVALEETIDGIYIFASICVGLAAGIGFLGIATIMVVFFCYTNAILWGIQYGRNPIDDARVERRISKLLDRE